MTFKTRMAACLKRHAFLWLRAIVTLTALAMVGIALTDIADTELLASLRIEKNSAAFLIWRLAFYTSVLRLWPPEWLKRSHTSVTFSDAVKKNTLLHCRQHLSVALILYEFLVVQNAVGQLMGMQ